MVSKELAIRALNAAIDAILISEDFPEVWQVSAIDDEDAHGEGSVEAVVETYEQSVFVVRIDYSVV